MPTDPPGNCGLVYTIPSHCLEGTPCELNGRLERGAGDEPLVEVQEVVLRQPEPSIHQIRQPHHDHEILYSRLHTVCEDLYQHFRPRNSQGIPDGDRQVGVQDAMAQQLRTFIYFGLYGGVCEAKGHVGALEAAHGQPNCPLRFPHPVPVRRGH